MTMSLQTTYNAAPAIGYSGLLEGEDHDIITMKSVEATNSMPFGTAVVFKLSGPASDLDALQPATQADLVVGIIAHSHAYSRVWTAADGTVYGDLDQNGLRPNALLNIVRKGKILVTCPSGCLPGDRLYVRADATGGGEIKGACENAADAADMIDCTKQGQWLTTAVAGGLAWLDVDFVNKP